MNRMERVNKDLKERLEKLNEDLKSIDREVVKLQMEENYKLKELYDCKLYRFCTEDKLLLSLKPDSIRLIHVHMVANIEYQPHDGIEITRSLRFWIHRADGKLNVEEVIIEHYDYISDTSIYTIKSHLFEKFNNIGFTGITEEYVDRLATGIAQIINNKEEI